ncbi:MAG: hypothetical protein RLZZ299_1577 [Pseudomonadota bacterium]|jgi:Flp pilus assembly protein TadD
MSGPDHRRAEALLALGRPRDAVALLETVPDDGAPGVAHLRLRGRALRASGRVFDAEAAFREALSLAPGEPGLRADLAATLHAQGRHEEALVHAQEACALQPDVYAWHGLRGVIADVLGRRAEAAAAFAQACALAPGDAEVRVLLGWHGLQAEQPAVAEGAFRAALGLAPGHAEALHGLARARLAQGDWEQARGVWLDALAVDPRLRDAALDRARTFGTARWRFVRALAGTSRAVSLGLGALAGGVLAGFAAAPGALLLGGSFLCLAAAPPLARRAVSGRWM